MALTKNEELMLSLLLKKASADEKKTTAKKTATKKTTTDNSKARSKTPFVTLRGDKATKFEDIASLLEQLGHTEVDVVKFNRGWVAVSKFRDKQCISSQRFDADDEDSKTGIQALHMAFSYGFYWTTKDATEETMLALKKVLNKKVSNGGKDKKQGGQVVSDILNKQVECVADTNKIGCPF